MGLAHSGSYDASLGNPSYQNDAAYYQDSLQYSIMSYFNAGYSGADTKGVYGYGPMVDDIAAIQKLYGANMSTRTGDTVYGFNSNTGRDFLTATADNGKPVNFAVWDAGGNDTLDFSGYSQQQMINLNDGAFSSVGGGTQSTVAAFDVIEDFGHGIDKIDLSGLRFNNSLSELRFIDSGSAFSGQKGEIQLNFDAFNGTTDLLMNTQSNSYAADFKIHVVGQVEQSDILFA
nr:M10 family metallopeptidase C-terminal domain-containing protein [Serratia sp. HRI]